MLLHQGLLKETERRKAELSGLMETSSGLQTLVQGSEAELEDKIFSLNESWGQVRTLTEDWLSAVLVGGKCFLQSKLIFRLCFLQEWSHGSETLNLSSPLCVQSHQNEVEIFDENLAHISTWLYQTQIHLDEAERLPLAEREKVVKVRLLSKKFPLNLFLEQNR